MILTVSVCRVRQIYVWYLNIAELVEFNQMTNAFFNEVIVIIINYDIWNDWLTLNNVMSVDTEDIWIQLAAQKCKNPIIFIVIEKMYMYKLIKTI